RRPLLLVAAAVILAGLTTWILFRPAARRIETVQAPDLESDEELLTYTVEHWELLHDDDLDVWLASLDPTEELLIEYADGATWLDDGDNRPAPAARQGD